MKFIKEKKRNNFLKWLEEYVLKNKKKNIDDLDWNELCSLNFRFGDLEIAYNNGFEEGKEKGNE